MSRPTLRSGSVVRIRQEHWRVATEWPLDRVSILDVDGCDSTNSGARARFILPHERVDVVLPPRATPRFVSRERWRRGVRAALADAVPEWGSLRAAARAQLSVFPFQLEPALAVTRGATCRVLIADEVGLGKTIQAGLIVAECSVRVPDARILIVSPAGLREQWRDELTSRFDLSPYILDAEGIARMSAHVAPDVNPWTLHPVAISSIDYVKRPEVMRSLEPLAWDVLVFDEAHALAGRSDRASAAAALARRSRVVVMLTATPHTGDDEAFARLTSIGDLASAFPLTTFHRTRSDVGLPHDRRTTNLRVQVTSAEAAMHRSLATYLDRLVGDRGADAGAALLSAVLTRRACSSASSLVRSLERRLNLLGNAAAAAASQTMLPFDDPQTDDEPGDVLGVPGLRSESEERDRLRNLIDLARSAAAHESKCSALTRLVRRLREPVLVFTEYRDTLERLAEQLAQFRPVLLHGLLSRRERSEVLRRFTCGDASLLLATDAASEGLNLHRRCRVVVNLELPWTPLRLEQRIGRVDRLGQSQRVHAVQLVAAGTREEWLARRLDDRITRIGTALLRRTDGVFSTTAEAEASRLRIGKSLAESSRPSRMPTIPFVTATRTGGNESAIWATHLPCVDMDGHTAFEAFAGFHDQRCRLEPDAALRQAIERRHADVLASTAAAMDAWVELSLRREHALIDALRETQGRLSAALLQPGLFDRRAERTAAAQAARVQEAIQRSVVRLSTLGRSRTLRVGEPVILFGIRFQR